MTNPWHHINAAQLRRDGLHRYARAARHITIAAAVVALSLTLTHAALQTALALPVLTGQAQPWKDMK